MNVRRAMLLLVVGSALIRIVTSVVLGLGNDEAYHALYAAHPALSYFDHPPMMAWVELAGMSVAGGQSSQWALRIGFIVLFAGSTVILARITARYFGELAGFLAALALNLTGYYGLAASMFALPDGPLLFFWLLTLDRLSLAVEDRPDGGLARWLQVGLAWGGAMLSKYHAIFLPAGTVVFLLLDRRRRKQLLTPGPYLAIAVGLLVFSPVILWNARHDWVSFTFQGGRAVGGWTLRPDCLAIAVLAQAGYLFPWIWLSLVLVLVREWRTGGARSAGPEGLWLCISALPLGAFTAVACFRPVLPHWGLIGLVPIFPLLGRAWAERLAVRPRAFRRRLSAYAGLSLTLVTLAVVEYRTGWFQRGPHAPVGILDARSDPTLDLYGWDQVAARIRQLGLIDDPGSFVFTRYWYQSAQLARALHGQRPALCYNKDDPRGFAFWSRPDDWLGRDGVLVLVGDEPEVVARYYGRYFTGVERADEFWVERAGKPVRRIRLYRCRKQDVAYPFALDREERVAQAESQMK